MACCWGRWRACICRPGAWKRSGSASRLRNATVCSGWFGGVAWGDWECTRPLWGTDRCELDLHYGSQADFIIFSLHVIKIWGWIISTILSASAALVTCFESEEGYWGRVLRSLAKIVDGTWHRPIQPGNTTCTDLHYQRRLSWLDLPRLCATSCISQSYCSKTSLWLKYITITLDFKYISKQISLMDGPAGQAAAFWEMWFWVFALHLTSLEEA